jgi:hypothetical protein
MDCAVEVVIREASSHVNSTSHISPRWPTPLPYPTPRGQPHWRTCVNLLVGDKAREDRWGYGRWYLSMWELVGQRQDNCGRSSPCAILLFAQHRLFEKLRQRLRRGFDISGGEHAGDYRDAIGTGVDDLLHIVDGDAADGEYRHLHMLLDLPKNPQ